MDTGQDRAAEPSEQGATVRDRAELVDRALGMLLAGAPIGYAVLDADLRFVMVNEHLAAINGRPAAEHVGRSLGEVVPTLAATAEPLFRQVLASGEPLREMELSGELPSAPGVQRHWTESVYPVPDAQGRPTGLAVVVFEDTGRVEAERARARALALLDMLVMRAPIGIAFLDTELRYMRINETLAAINGVAVVDHLGRAVPDVLPELAPEVVPLLQRVLDRDEPITDLEVETGPTPGDPGRRRHWRVSYYPIPAPSGDGTAEGVGLIVVDETDRHEARRERRRLREAERAAAERVRNALHRQEQLSRLTSALAGATTVAEVADTMVRLAPAVLGASAATLSEYRAGSGLRVLAAAGLPDEVVAAGSELAEPLPPLVRSVLGQSAPVLVGSRADRDRRFPSMAGWPVRQEAWANLALCSHGRPTGFLAFGWDRPREFDAEDVKLLTALADQCAVAIDRARLHREEREAREAAERAQQRLDILARAGQALSRSLDESAVLGELASLLVPEHTDWLAVLLAGRSGQLVTRCSVHRDPVIDRAARDLLAARPLSVQGGTPAARVFRSQEALVVDDVHPQLTGPEAVPEVARFAELLGPGPGALAPLVVGGRSIGVLSLVGGGEAGETLVRDRALVTELASRAAAALENARLYGQRARVAARLQESLLPARLPDIAGVELAVRYAAAEDVAKVGGDFYDVIPVDEGWLLVVGDVCGRGVEAAGVTGLARHTLAAVAHDLPPSAALARLNEILYAQHDPARFLTAACARFTRHGDGTATVRLARAGHEPPVLVRADGTATPLLPAGRLLGAFPEVDLEIQQITLHPGDALVLYTDGITEARGADGFFGEQRVADALAAVVRERAPAAGPPSATDLVDAVLAAVAGYRTVVAEDDTALLAIRLQ